MVAGTNRIAKLRWIEVQDGRKSASHPADRQRQTDRATVERTFERAEYKGDHGGEYRTEADPRHDDPQRGDAAPLTEDDAQQHSQAGKR